MLGEAQRKAILEIREVLDERLDVLEDALYATDRVRTTSWDAKELMVCVENFRLIKEKRKEAVDYAADLIEELHNQIEELNNGNKPRKYSSKYGTH